MIYPLQVLIVSYETFRMHCTKFSHSESCDLLICDEAHRLKNDQTMTNKVWCLKFLATVCHCYYYFWTFPPETILGIFCQALAALSCKRRILLSGTPMQVGLNSLWFVMIPSYLFLFICNTQNDLEEFYAMVNFTNPGILGDAAHFRRYYEVSWLHFLCTPYGLSACFHIMFIVSFVISFFLFLACSSLSKQS